MIHSSLLQDATSLENNMNSDESSNDFYAKIDIELRTTDHTESYLNDLWGADYEQKSIYENNQTQDNFSLRNQIINPIFIEQDEKVKVIKCQSSVLGEERAKNEVNNLKVRSYNPFSFEFRKIRRIQENKADSNLEIEYDSFEQIQIQNQNLPNSFSGFNQINSEHNYSSNLFSQQDNELKTQNLNTWTLDEQKQFCQQVHIQNLIDYTTSEISQFQISYLFKDIGQDEFKLSKTFISIQFMEFFKNSLAQTNLCLHQQAVKALHKIEEVQTNQNEILSFILKKSSAFYSGEIICDQQISIITGEGMEAKGKCVWQAYPANFNSQFVGTLIKQTWFITNQQQIVDIQLKNQENSGNNKVQSLQEQADSLDQNIMEHTPFSLSVTKLLRKFKYIQKQKKIKGKIILQELYPHKTCKYRAIPINKSPVE